MPVPRTDNLVISAQTYAPQQIASVGNEVCDRSSECRMITLYRITLFA